MDRLHAAYPFLDAARAAVEREGVDLAAAVADEGTAGAGAAGGPGPNPVVQRAVERVTTAIHEGTVGPVHRSTRVELVSYPVARALVSVLDRPPLTERYAAAEAATARERFVADLGAETLQSVDGEPLTLDRLLREFDLAGAVTAEDAPEAAGSFRVAVGPYLELAGGLAGEDWRLVNRRLADGAVPVERTELYALLEQAVRRRVAGGLPLPVPDPVAAELADAVAEVERELADYAPRRDVDAVVPALFPPCVRALLDRVRDGEDLPLHSRFSLVAFLTSIGLEPEEVTEFCGVTPPATPPTAYPPPSCATMDDYGDCVNTDEVCERVPTPLAYYERRLGETDPERLGDWREAD
jgi:DNA primase large subunit